MKAAVTLSLVFVAQAGATAMYDYKPGEFLVIDGGTSPDKKFSIIYANDGTPKPWKARHNSNYSAIVKWISPMRFVAREQSQWQIKERDPAATLGKYGEAEKSEDESDESPALYHVWFDAEGECELLPNDESQVLTTQPVKEQKTKE